MKAIPRAIVGFAVGSALTVSASLMTVYGHGTSAAMIANVSALFFIPRAGIPIALLVPPFLWLTYFLFIPKIGARTKRIFAVVLVALFHFIPAIWISMDRRASYPTLKYQTDALMAQSIALTISLAFLAYVSATVAGKPDLR